jgi:hypothetical protein
MGGPFGANLAKALLLQNIIYRCKFRRKDRKKRFRGWALACHIRHADRLKTCVRNIARRMAKVDTNPDG